MGQVIDEVLYGRLLAERLPRKIHSDAEYDSLADELERITFSSKASAEESAYAELLTDLLGAYDRENAIAGGKSATGADVLQLLMESQGLKQVDLVSVIGSSAYVSQILSGKRGISKAMAQRLGEFFSVDASVFLGLG